eukprot:NODE_988_length_2781_cov_0.348248.p3 type:complete len:126 gc:universal NODE_988_length_2781_cov_0.348248:173-550(+)
MQFRILQCQSCSIYQVDIVKKAKKWKCKVCGISQSVSRVFYLDNDAKTCRKKVQQMNMSHTNGSPKVSKQSSSLQDSALSFSFSKMKPECTDNSVADHFEETEPSNRAKELIQYTKDEDILNLLD